MFNIFQEYPNLVVAVSERKDGSMKFLGVPEKDGVIYKNREAYFKKIGINPGSVVRAGLIHGSSVSVITQQNSGSMIDNTDGLLTQDKDLFLTITIADCLPVFLYEPNKKIVGLIHCGWRSLAKKIISKTIQKLILDLEGKPESVLVEVGPGISKCHFEVGEEVLAAFQDLDRDKIITRRENKIFLDLKEIAKTQLIKDGIKEKNIKVSPECTYCLKNKYFSYRRDKPRVLETMVAAMGRRG